MKAIYCYVEKGDFSYPSSKIDVYLSICCLLSKTSRGLFLVLATCPALFAAVAYLRVTSMDYAAFFSGNDFLIVLCAFVDEVAASVSTFFAVSGVVM